MNMRHEINLKTGEAQSIDEDIGGVGKNCTPYSALRAQAYRNESDPIFFKEQRGEVPAGTWLASVAEIKARYPVAE